MAGKWFFDDDIPRLEAGALVKGTERSEHSQPVHDCRMVLLSDSISIVLCLKSWTIPRLRTPYTDETFYLGVSGAQHQDQHQMDTERVQQQ